MTFDTVDARGLTKVYGRQRALAGVDLTLRAGEATALLGPNGAGKSTLVGILATLVSPTRGQVRYGAPSDEPATRRRRAARAPSASSRTSRCCYGDLTGRENLIFFARLYGVADAAARRRALLARVGLDRRGRRARRAPTRAACCSGWPSRAPSCTSRGCSSPTSRSPASTAPAWRCSPSSSREERARGCIMVVVTHDFDAVAPLVDRVVVLARGRVAHDRAGAGGAHRRQRSPTSIARPRRRYRS